jgi:hypothetical protein
MLRSRSWTKTRSDIEDPKVIPKPVETLSGDSPSFPELAFHYLSPETLSPDNRRSYHNQRSRVHEIPYGRHVLILKSYCSKSVLDTACQKWEALNEIQQKMQWEIAKEMKSRCDLYQQVWNGLHSAVPEEHQHFKSQCFQSGFAELKSLLETGVKWEAVTWERFGDLEGLYEPLPVSGGEVAGENKAVHTRRVIRARISECKPRRKDDRVVYGTPEPELELRRENRSRSPEL